MDQSLPGQRFPNVKDSAPRVTGITSKLKSIPDPERSEMDHFPRFFTFYWGMGAGLRMGTQLNLCLKDHLNQRERERKRQRQRQRACVLHYKYGGLLPNIFFNLHLLMKSLLLLLAFRIRPESATLHCFPTHPTVPSHHLLLPGILPTPPNLSLSTGQPGLAFLNQSQIMSLFCSKI